MTPQYTAGFGKWQDSHIRREILLVLVNGSSDT